MASALVPFERQMVGPVQPLACHLHHGTPYHCVRPKAEHREGFPDLRDGVIDHGFVLAPPLALPHECTPAMVTTEWYCHMCGEHNDVWGTGATESYMECGHCFAWSWLDFDPDGFGTKR